MAGIMEKMRELVKEAGFLFNTHTRYMLNNVLSALSVSNVSQKNLNLESSLTVWSNIII